MDHDEYHPDPEPGGALVPPGRFPPTAVGVATPPPPRPPRPLAGRARQSRFRRLLALIADTTLDAADRAGDAIAGVLGIRHPGRRTGPPPAT